ncbi:MAG: hypothetical protein WD737_10410 [Gemmatimonadota bacterium]
MATTKIIETAPLHGIDLTVSDVRLPHQEPAPVRSVAPARLDGSGALAAEPGATEAISDWRDTADFPVPPRLRPDAEQERARLSSQSVDIMTALQTAAALNGTRDRGFQRKTLYATTTGVFRAPSNLPRDLHAGPFTPGAEYRAIVRFANAASTAQPDTEPDQRAVGVRITDDAGRVQDLTFTSGAAGNHARDAPQFNSTMKATLRMTGGGLAGRVIAIVGLLLREGPRQTLRLVRARRSAVDSGVSLAALRYYSRSPLEMGTKLVHLALLPIDDTAEALVHEARGARDGLGRDLCLRRSEGDVRFRIAAAEAPGLDDMSRRPRGPWVTVGEITLPRQRTSEAEMLNVAARLHGELAMHPFNVWEPGTLVPRGELNEILRGPVYAASARNSGRSDDPPATPSYGL